MTLAFTGKSRRRQQGLAFAALIAIIFGALAGASIWHSERADAAPETFFVHGFPDEPTSEVPGWETTGVATSVGGAAVIQGDGSSMQRVISTVGFTDITASFSCRGNEFNDETGDDIDELAAEYSTTGTAGPWSTLAEYATGTSTMGCQNDQFVQINLDLSGNAAVENNPNFALRFRSVNHDGGGEAALIGQVEVSGEPAPHVVNMDVYDGEFQVQVYWTVRFFNQGPGGTVDVTASYDPNGTGTILAGMNGQISGCSYSPLLWTDCEMTLNPSTTQITFFTTVPAEACTPSPEVALTVTATLNGTPIPYLNDLPGGTGVYTHPATTTGCDEGELAIDKADTAEIVDDGASLEWTINLDNSAETAMTAHVYDEGATLVDSQCVGGATATQTGNVISCSVPPGDAGNPPEATITLKTPYQPSQQERCKGGTVTNTAYLVSSSTSTPGTGDASDTATAHVTPHHPDPGCITVGKHSISEGVWHIVFTNTGAEVQVNFSDTYEPLGSDKIESITIDGNPVTGCAFNAGSTEASGCRISLPDGIETASETTVVVTSGQVAGTCTGVTVSNSVRAFFGPGVLPGPELPGSPSTAEYEDLDAEECYRFVKLCKVWRLDAVGEISDGKADFQFNVRDQDNGKGDPDEVITIVDVTEGGDPACVVLRVRAGLVSFDEVGPGQGFVFDGWTGALGPDPDLGPIDGTARPLYVVVGDFCVEPQPGLTANALQLVAQIQSVVVVPGPEPYPIRCTITYFNHDTEDRLPTGGLRIEKYLDFNGDGDSEDIALGEGLIDWDVTISGPDPAVAGPWDLPGGVRAFSGLKPGDLYSVTEAVPPGWKVTRVSVNGLSLGPPNNAAAAIISNGGTSVIRFYNQPIGSIEVRKLAVTSYNGGADQPAPDDDDGWVVSVVSQECGVNRSETTDAAGRATFAELPLCDDYVVSEEVNNAPSPGFVPVGPASFANQAANGQTVTFVNRKTTSGPACTNCTPTPTPTVVTPTPTVAVPSDATSVPPTAVTGTPTGVAPTPTGTATPAPSATADIPGPAAPGGPIPVTQVAGERTAPPAESTPLAPSTGSGNASHRGGGLNIVLVLVGGLAALGGSAGLLALKRRA